MNCFRSMLFAAVALASLSPGVAAERHLMQLPPNAGIVAAKIKARLTPRIARWTETEAVRLHDGVIQPSQLGGEARHLGALPPGADIEELCFVVLMQATKDQDQDLMEIMAETKAQTTAKTMVRNDVTRLQLQTLERNLQVQLDSKNEMSAADSLRLQMAMDRRSKFVEALSNILKKIEQTDDSILQNMK